MALSPERFEQLTFELVGLQYPDAQRVAAPDGGADTLVLGDVVRVWQAKRSRKRIDWMSCERSLRRALTRWQPASVVFVFPVDLTESQLRTFQTRLADKAEGTEVSVWSASTLLSRLNQHPELLRRFFGPSQADLLDVIELSARVGGPADTAPEILDRLSALGDAADRQDPNFQYQYTVGPHGSRRETSPDAAFTLRIRTERSEIWLNALPRPGSPNFVSIRFQDSEQGEEARSEVVQAIARGEQIAGDLPGLEIDRSQATVVKELEDAGYGISWDLRSLGPGEAVIFYIEVTEPSGRSTGWRLEARSVPPRPSYDSCLAGWVGTCLVEIAFRRIDEDHLYVKFDFTAFFRDEATPNDEGAHFFLAANSGGAFSFRLPIAGLEAGTDEWKCPYDEKDLARMRSLKDRFAAIRLLEGVFHYKFPIPETLDPQETLNILVAAALWRYRFALEPYFALKVHMRRSGLVGARQKFEEPLRMPARFVICRIGVELGIAEYRYPPLAIESVQPIEAGADPVCEVTLEAAEDGQAAEVRLLKRAPRLLTPQPPA